MPLYTRHGDAGQTSVYGPRKLPKNHPLIEALGTIDELSSHLGLLRAQLQAAAPAPAHDHLQQLEAVQQELLRAGAVVALVPEAPLPAPHAIAQLEREADRLTALRGAAPFAFVLPGGTLAAAQAHVARTVCRRAERRLVEAEQLSLVPYFNRLADYLYALALTL